MNSRITKKIDNTNTKTINNKENKIIAQKKELEKEDQPIEQKPNLKNIVGATRAMPRIPARK